MKYNRINSQGQTVWFLVKCSKCNHDVEYSDNFCRSCGNRLTPLPESAEMYDVCDILTFAYKGKKKIAEQEGDEK